MILNFDFEVRSVDIAHNQKGTNFDLASKFGTLISLLTDIEDLLH
jgi:hypothetical protein